MSRPGLTHERLVALFLLGVLLFTPPFLGIFNTPDRILGLPSSLPLPVRGLDAAHRAGYAGDRKLGRRRGARQDGGSPAGRLGGDERQDGSLRRTHAQRADHRHHRVPLPVSPVRHRLLRRQARGSRTEHHRQSVHLRAVDRRLLHVLDVLRQRRPRRLERRRISADLYRPDPDFHSGLVPDPQDHSHQQGQPYHLDRRFHRLPLRQELQSRRPGDDHRGGRDSSVHLAAAQSDLHELLGAARLSGDRDAGAIGFHSDPAGHRALCGPHHGGVRHPVRDAAYRCERAPRGNGGGHRLRVGGQAAGVPRRRGVRHLRGVRGIRRPVLARRFLGRSGQAVHHRCGHRLHELDLAHRARHAGDFRLAATVPGARGRERRRAARQEGRLAVPALSSPHQYLRAAHRLRRPAPLPARQRGRRHVRAGACRWPSASRRSRCSPSSAGFPPRPA